MADLKKERGIFWWADTEVPPGHFAPSQCVAGTLTIREDDSPRLELDGVLSEEEPYLAVLRKPVPGRRIAGMLKSDNRYILLDDLHRQGGRWSSNGISYDGFGAQTCLVSRQMLPKTLKVRIVEFDLTGYEEWLRSGRLEKQKTQRSLTLKHRRVPSRTYRSEAGSLALVRDIEANERGYFGSRGFEFRETAKLRFRPSKALPLNFALESHGLIQELMILLTGSEYQAALPVVALTTGQWCDVYAARYGSKADPPDAYDCILSFPEVATEFGDIFFRWLGRRNELGPGSYLYLATRRGLHLHEEHKFINLMWGLESLHRSLSADVADPALTEKLARILDDIKSADDRRWLKKRTKHFGDPSLEERLIELLSSVPSGIEATKLKEFCRVCAKMRNDLSHGGRSGDASLTANPLQFVATRNEILSVLYHAKLLLEIGVSRDIVERWLTKGRDSARFAWFLDQAGVRKSEPAAPV